METYRSYGSSVGNNFKHVQLTTKCRYKMMRKDYLRTYCRVAIEEACKRHHIEIVILKVMDDHVHMIVDCPRMMPDTMLIQILKGLSSYLLFRMCPALRKRYPKGHFWHAGYFCCSVGAEFEQVFKYIENQEKHHA